MQETNQKARSSRLYPIKEYLFNKGLSMADLSKRCDNLSKGGVSYRIRVGDCLMQDMVEMAEKAGYRFVWYWEDIDPLPEDAVLERSPRPMIVFHSELLKPVAKYMMRKGISTAEMARRLGNISGPGVAFRLREGVCMISQMEEMAAAAGYKFVWYWEDAENPQE